MKNQNLKRIPFDVYIPNLDGDGIAETIQIEVQAYTDPETGEDVLTPESLELIEKTQARHMGLMSAGEIKELRQRLGLSQDEMSELLQIGGKSYTRWESGRARPSRSMNVLLCALRDGQMDVNYLTALRDPETQTLWRARADFQRYFAAWLPAATAHVAKRHKASPTASQKIIYWECTSPQAVFPHQSTKKKVSRFRGKSAQSKSQSSGLRTSKRLPTDWQQRMNYLKSRSATKQSDNLIVG